MLILVLISGDQAAYWKIISHGAISQDPFRGSKTNLTGSIA